MNPAIGTILMFAAVLMAALGIYSGMVARRNPASQRLQDLRRAALEGTPGGPGRGGFSLRLLAGVLGGFLPGDRSRDTLRTGLVRAGIRHPDSVMVFLGSKVILAVCLPMVWVFLGWMLGRPAGSVTVQAFILVAVGFYLPTAWLWARTNRRRTQIRMGLPDALDLMVVCVEAGQGLGAAIERVADEMALLCPALADELHTVNQEMLAGVTRTDALRRLAERTTLEDVYSLVAMLIHADRLGTSIAQSLRVHAQAMRTRRRQRAEQMARKASIKMLFPLVFLILPALMVVILGPAAIQLLKVVKASG